MADPRIRPATLTPNKRGANLSKLKAAQIKAPDKQRVNACPYGCKGEDLDENGYCHHIVGWSNDKKTMFPFLAPDHRGRRAVSGQAVPIPKGAKCMRETVSYRVYLEGAKPFPPVEYTPPPKKQKNIDQLSVDELAAAIRRAMFPEQTAKGA